MHNTFHVGISNLVKVGMGVGDDGQWVEVGKLEFVIEHTHVRPASQPQPWNPFSALCVDFERRENFARRSSKSCFDNRIVFRNRTTNYSDGYQSVKVGWV